MSTDKILTIGYGGSVSIDGSSCLVTSASINQTYNIPTLNAYYQPYDDSGAVSLIRAAKGTCAFSGEVSFQLTQNMLNKVLAAMNGTTYTGFFAKSHKFTVDIHDGENSVSLPGCVWTSINIQCQPSSLVTCSISFQSNNSGNESWSSSSLKSGYDSSALIPYWNTGDGNMLKFNISFERNVTPVYLNNDKIAPTYLRPGLIRINLSATYYQEISKNSLSVNIGNKKIKFEKAVLQSSNFQMSTMQDIGEKTYQWTSIPLDYTKPVFSISSVS